jgi:hypothetical protein
MRKNCCVTRVGMSKIVEFKGIEAVSPRVAAQLGLNKAYDYSFSDDASEYLVDGEDLTTDHGGAATEDDLSQFSATRGKLRRFRVGVARDGYRTKEVVVEGRSARDCKAKAKELAGGMDFPSEHTSRYFVHYVEEE